MSDETGDVGHDVGTDIFVNTRPHFVHGKFLTFDQVVAFYDGPVLAGPNVDYTVTYRKGPAKNPSGDLEAGQHVVIQEGMIFNVTPTDKS